MNRKHRALRAVRHTAATLLLAGAALPSLAAGPSISARDVAADPAGAWERFLATAEYVDAYDAYGVLGEVGYSLLDVDAQACVEQADALRDAVAKAPVSIAIHRARMLCAEASGDEDAAEASMLAMAALSQLALEDGRETFWPKPIRVLGPMDIYALVLSSGLQFRYEYFVSLKPRRYFTLNVATWDDVLEVERHLAFDYIDVVNAISRGDRYSGYPFQRELLAESFVESQVAVGEAQAIDWQSVSAAAAVDPPAEKIAALRPGADAGGVQSLATWLVVCGRNPSDGCTDGLVDALLPHAEKEHAAHTVLLSVAYAAGIGVERDDAAATALLDAADRRWYGGGALSWFAQTWGLLGREAPAFLHERLASVAAQGNVAAPAISAWLALIAPGTPQLEAAQVAALSHASNNKLGMGYSLLVNYHRQRNEPVVSNAWLKFASDAGDPDAQAAIGVSLFERATTDAGRDEALRLVMSGAQGGSAHGMRFMAYRSRLEKDWAAVQGWLLAAATAGNIEALLELAELYEWERPGVEGTPGQAADVYQALASEPPYAEARRRLAAMALAGRGIDKDIAQAERWLLQDAEAGDGESALQLAGFYLVTGEGMRDEDKGKAWMERALELGNNDAYVDYGSWYFDFNDNSLASRRRGLELWDLGAEAGVRWSLNNAAWARCTAPEPEFFDPERGLADAAKIMEGDGEVPMGMLDTVAACHAAAGDFARAVELQQQVVDSLDADEIEADAQRERGFASRLDEYRAGKRHVVPHRDATATEE